MYHFKKTAIGKTQSGYLFSTMITLLGMNEKNQSANYPTSTFRRRRRNNLELRAKIAYLEYWGANWGGGFPDLEFWY